MCYWRSKVSQKEQRVAQVKLIGPLLSKGITIQCRVLEEQESDHFFS